MTKLAIILSGIGLVLDIIGVYKLYNTRIKGLGQIKEPDIRTRNSVMGGSPNDPVLLINDLVSKINDTVRAMNNDNQKAEQKSVKWLYLILAGFFLQLTSSFLYFFNSGFCISR